MIPPDIVIKIQKGEKAISAFYKKLYGLRNVKSSSVILGILIGIVFMACILLIL
jgi:hypothetical protein